MGLRTLIFISALAVVLNGQDSRAPKTWALLVAGSSEWYNYRHQADVFHAYQILKAHKIPDENIVMMFYDDIAFHQENPTPGIVINHPNGSNVYKNIPKDYTGKNVTSENFIHVLTGNEEAMRGVGSGKVIKSTKNDRVFINFVDHGGPGVLCFPDGELTVGELQKALKKMKKENRYKEMVLYIEACESGSMFRNVLSSDMNIFVTTAASFNESSYACYLDETRDTYLGDCYSVNWMEDTDKEDIVRETLYNQFLLVKKETNESHVKSFGDMKIARLPVADFQGEGPSTKILYPKVPRSPVPSHDVPLHLLIAKLSKYNHAETMAKYRSLIKKRKYLDKIMKHVVRQIADDDQRAEDWLMRRSVDKFENLDCFTDLVHSYSKHCFNLGRNSYALRYVHSIAHMCNHNVTLAKASKVFRTYCGKNLLFNDGII